ncbi:MAG: type IX secretion system membrane protein PorP/SprF [Bacteroidia bacterium]|nr:type IX secretion system membrane protein PorP/SprF [Bacteroidia bacterium]
MRKFILIPLLIIIGFGLKAQQDPQYSQYMFNGLVLNPAYAGNLSHLNVTLIAREQWVGIPGRPRTQSLAIDGPSRNRKHGFGGVIVNDVAGKMHDLRISGSYAYRIHFTQNAILSMGLQLSMDNINTNFTKLYVDDPSDATISTNTVNGWAFNTGAGLFFQNKVFFAGFSMPEILTNNLAKAPYLMRQDRNYLATAGVILKLGDQVKLRPSTLLKINTEVGMQADINLLAVLKDKYWFGGSYRTSDAIVLMTQWQISPQWRVGYAYDLTTSPLRTRSSGSHEIVLNFELNYEKESQVNPRFFR